MSFNRHHHDHHDHHNPHHHHQAPSSTAQVFNQLAHLVGLPHQHAPAAHVHVVPPCVPVAQQPMQHPIGQPAVIVAQAPAAHVHVAPASVVSQPYPHPAPVIHQNPQQFGHDHHHSHRRC